MMFVQNLNTKYTMNGENIDFYKYFNRMLSKNIYIYFFLGSYIVCMFVSVRVLFGFTLTCRSMNRYLLLTLPEREILAAFFLIVHVHCRCICVIYIFLKFSLIDSDGQWSNRIFGGDESYT